MNLTDITPFLAVWGAGVSTYLFFLKIRDDKQSRTVHIIPQISPVRSLSQWGLDEKEIGIENTLGYYFPFVVKIKNLSKFDVQIEHVSIIFEDMEDSYASMPCVPVAKNLSSSKCIEATWLAKESVMTFIVEPDCVQSAYQKFSNGTPYCRLTCMVWTVADGAFVGHPFAPKGDDILPNNRNSNFKSLRT